MKYYKDLSTETCVRRPWLDGLDFGSISEVEQDSLEIDFLKRKWQLLSRNVMNIRRQGSDGFTMAFLMEAWSSIGGILWPYPILLCSWLF